MAVISRETDRQAPSRAVDALALMSTPWVLVPILLATFVVYAPTLSNWFLGDDFWFLRASQQHGIGSEIVRSFDYRNVGASIEFDRYRPLYSIIWRLEFAAFGLHAFPYHAILLALHLACVVTVWLIARRLLPESWMANLATLIFALHPTYVDAVASISAGNRVYAALPYLLALFCYMRSRDAGERRAGTWYWGAFALFVAAVLLHSASMTLAAVLVLYRGLIAGEPRDLLRPREWLPFVPYAIVVVASTVVQAQVRAQFETAENAFRFGYHMYGNYGLYLGMAVQPIDSSNFSGAFGHLLADARGVGSVALLLASVAVMVRSRQQRVAVFVVAWFFLAPLPDSTLILAPSGRSAYLPGAPLAIALVLILAWLHDDLPALQGASVRRAGPYVAAAVVPIVMFTIFGRTLGITHDAARADALRTTVVRDVAAMPAGTFYISNAPRGMVTFDESSRLDAMLELYYGDARIVYVPASQVAKVKAALGPDDRFYEYRP
jgi:hypothetical protein